MDAIDEVREKITDFYEKDMTVHIGITKDRNKKQIEVFEAKIVGIYPRIFRVLSQGKYYTFQYVEILIKKIILSEI